MGYGSNENLIIRTDNPEVAAQVANALLGDDITKFLTYETGYYDTNGVKLASASRLRISASLTFYTDDIISIPSTMDMIIMDITGGVTPYPYLKSFDGKLTYRFTAKQTVLIYFKKLDGTNFDLTTFDTTQIQVKSPINRRQMSDSRFTSLQSVANINKSIYLENGTINTDGTFASSDYAIRTPFTYKFKVGDVITVDSTLRFALLTLTGGIYSVSHGLTDGNSYTFTADGECLIYFKKTDGTALNIATVNLDLITIISPTNITPKKPLNTKKAAFVGDSLTDLTVHTPNKYHRLLAVDTGLTVLDYGKSGTGFKRTEESNTAFYQRVSTIPSDTDIVIIFGGGNDCSQNYPLGELTDTGTTTLCGCINTTLDNVETAAPLAQIAIVSPTPWSIYPLSDSTNYMSQMTEKLRQIANLRGYKFLDLYRTSGLRPLKSSFVTQYYVEGSTTTSVHLNEAGHKFIYPAFKQLVLSMIDRLSN